jgi:hypothetical protein
MRPPRDTFSQDRPWILLRTVETSEPETVATLLMDFNYGEF